jgi:hypothetical protein
MSSSVSGLSWEEEMAKELEGIETGMPKEKKKKKKRKNGQRARLYRNWYAQRNWCGGGDIHTIMEEIFILLEMAKELECIETGLRKGNCNVTEHTCLEREFSLV